MEPIGLPPTQKRGASQAGSGELILQNGRNAGSSRTLGMPLTFIGRSPGCDIRLNVDGIDPLHCLLAHGPEGLSLRDLNSSGGTYVNDQRVSQATLKPGDLLSVGPFKFRLHVPPVSAEDVENAARDPVRLQSAAVAAQQVALAEEEAKLVQRRAALEKQEEQLAAHLEEKRLKLLHLSERAQAESAALEKDRVEYEQHVEKVNGDLTESQRELVANQQKVENERKRLVELHRRIRQRWHRFWLAERQKGDRREEALAAWERALDNQAAVLADKRLRFQTLYELGRCRLREAWQRLRLDQYRWKHRRGKERAALKVRECDHDAAEQKLLQAQRLFIKEKRTWDSTRAALHTELEGLDERVRNQRDKILEQQGEIARLDAEILLRQQLREGLPELQVPGEAPPHLGQKAEPASDAAALAAPVSAPQFLMLRAQAEQPARLPAEAEPFDVSAADYQEAWHKRFLDLEKLAGDLADQRAQLIEQWHLLGRFQEHWEMDRQQSSAELEELARRLVDNGHLVAQREQLGQQADQVLRHRHDELVQVRQQMIAWRARLRVREKTWEGERQKLLTEVRNREELADRHLNTLVDLRQRWAKRRRQELDKLRQEHQALDSLRKGHGEQRLLLADQTTALETEKRVLAEKALALEQYRREFLSKVDNPTAERRLERLRRRWLTLNATAIRSAARERESLKTLLHTLEGRYEELHKRTDAAAQMEYDLIEKQTAWEHKQALAVARQARVQYELQSAEAQRTLSEQQVARMREEIERIARALIDEPDPPTSEALNQAA